MNLTRKRWAALSTAERVRTAKALVKELPNGFVFDAVRVCKLGTRENAVAFYTFGDSSFALVPGGPVTVGYDMNRLWEPTKEEEVSWAGTKEDFGIRGSISQHVARVTRRPKAITVTPMMVETVAGEIGWEPFDATDPEVRKLLREHRRAPQLTVSYSDGNTLRVSRKDGGEVTAERGAARTHAELKTFLKKRGFRFPTVDEWEYLCGAGAETLFRWGDHAPCDCYPVGSRSAHRTIHRRPNAFGLTIASDPYKFELTATPGTTRGGDGGHYACGGMGFFISWLTLSTAYFERDACRHDRAKVIDLGYTIGRRVLELA